MQQPGRPQTFRDVSASGTPNTSKQLFLSLVRDFGRFSVSSQNIKWYECEEQGVSSSQLSPSRFFRYFLLIFLTHQLHTEPVFFVMFVFAYFTNCSLSPWLTGSYQGSQREGPHQVVQNILEWVFQHMQLEFRLPFPSLVAFSPHQSFTDVPGAVPLLYVPHCLCHGHLDRTQCMQRQVTRMLGLWQL